MTNLRQPQLFSIERGKKLIASLLTHAKQNQLSSASFFGIGALKDPMLGYFNLEKKTYQYKNFEGIYELISLNGNITKFNDEYIVHTHVALSDENYQLIGGHLKEATIGVTAEITIIQLPVTVQRKSNTDVNLNLIAN